MASDRTTIRCPPAIVERLKAKAERIAPRAESLAAEGQPHAVAGLALWQVVEWLLDRDDAHHDRAAKQRAGRRSRRGHTPSGPTAGEIVDSGQGAYTPPVGTPEHGEDDG